MKTKTLVIILIGIVLFGSLGLGLFSVTGNERMARSFNSLVDPGATVIVTYIVSGTSGNWGASVIDTLTCPGIANQEKKFVIISDEGTKTIQYTLPNTEGTTCTFTGNYVFGDKTLFNFNTQTITTRITTISHYLKSCYDNDVYWYNSKNVLEDKYLECGTAGCLNGACKVCAIDMLYDTDCSGDISRNELGVSITKWLSGNIDRNLLGQIIQSWAS